MKPTSFFINTGRGQTVVESALIEALRQKSIAGAGLDVYAVEPLAKTSPLFKMPNVIMLPHVACLSVNYWRKQINLMEKNIRRFLQKKRLINQVDLSRGY